MQLKGPSSGVCNQRKEGLILLSSVQERLRKGTGWLPWGHLITLCVLEGLMKSSHPLAMVTVLPL